MDATDQFRECGTTVVNVPITSLHAQQFSQPAPCAPDYVTVQLLVFFGFLVSSCVWIGTNAVNDAAQPLRKRLHDA
jgi:hypothetical protein